LEVFVSGSCSSAGHFFTRPLLLLICLSTKRIYSMER
jgi:hypothetical protein